MLKRVSFIVIAVAAICAAIESPRNDSDINFDPYIVNGQASTRGQFPFYTLVLMNFDRGQGACGGSLIAENWVLTAAHCVDNTDIKSFTLHFGALNLTNFNEPGRVIVNATNAFIYPSWNRQLIWNDIALIRLDKPIQFSDTIQPISLERESLETHTALTAIGFGLQNTTDTTLAPILQHAQLHTISHLSCLKTFPFLIFRKSVVCTVGLNAESPCNGDSGGPLIKPNVLIPRAPTLVGLTSFGSGTCHLGKPAVFTRVASYTKWIIETIEYFSP